MKNYSNSYKIDTKCILLVIVLLIQQRNSSHYDKLNQEM